MPTDPDKTIKPPVCPYCGSVATLQDSIVIYKKSYGNVWICPKYPGCDSFIGCHPNGKPLGRMANKKLRQSRVIVHAYFDALWRRKVERDGCTEKIARTEAYKWLAKEMGLQKEACHIGMFDHEQCNRAAQLCEPYVKQLKR